MTSGEMMKNTRNKSSKSKYPRPSVGSFLKVQNKGLNFYPTPPAATSSLLSSRAFSGVDMKGLTCLEPACGAGHMSQVLEQRFMSVLSSDVHAYGYGKVEDFLSNSYMDEQFDCVITNPPFRLATAFAIEMRRVSRRFVAVFARTNFLEGQGRYEHLYSVSPPTYVLQFSERLSLREGQLDEEGNGATAYAWFIWDKFRPIDDPRVLWTGEMAGK